MALAEQNIGMNVQHYNPLVDEKVAAKYNIPSTWKLRAQAPFGSVVAMCPDVGDSPAKAGLIPHEI